MGIHTFKSYSGKEGLTAQLSEYAAWHAIGKVDRFAGKILVVQKQPLRTAFLSLRGAGGQTVHYRLTFGTPLKTYGHNASNELCGFLLATIGLSTHCHAGRFF